MILSYSRIATLLRCPRLYDLLYVQKVEVMAHPAAFLGGTVHHALGVAYRRKAQGVVLSSIEVALLFVSAFDQEAFLEDEERSQEVDWSLANRGEARDTGAALVKAYWESLQPQVEPMEVEFSVEQTVNGIRLHGRLDLITADGSWVDLKTTARAWGSSEVKRNLQADIYCLLLGTRRGSFHLLVKTKVPKCLRVPFERSPAHLEWVASRVLPQAAAQIESQIFPANPTSFLCTLESCQCWHICHQ